MCLMPRNTAPERDEHEGEDGHHAERLDAELVQPAAVEQAGLADRVGSASAGVVKRPQESVPQMPPMPCAAIAPIGSSTPSRSTSDDGADHQAAGDRRR